ncbi:CAPR2 protein, partial [Atractosteus spatula]|nr:CAPR2 protein [Atractosteus spatula]
MWSHTCLCLAPAAAASAAIHTPRERSAEVSAPVWVPVGSARPESGKRDLAPRVKSCAAEREPGDGPELTGLLTHGLVCSPRGWGGSSALLVLPGSLVLMLCPVFLLETLLGGCSTPALAAESLGVSGVFPAVGGLGGQGCNKGFSVPPAGLTPSPLSSETVLTMVQLSPSPVLDLTPMSEHSEVTAERQGSPRSPTAEAPPVLSSLQLALASSTPTYQGYDTYVENGLICLKHKIRNIEKKKLKLEDYKQRLKAGEALNQDQLDAVEKYDEVVHNLAFARELQKTFSSLSQDVSLCSSEQELLTVFELY